MMLKILLSTMLFICLGSSFRNFPVVTGYESFYIIDKLDKWGPEYYHKKVEVTGKFVVVIRKQKSTPTNVVQERVGKYKIIKNAKWKVVK
jgi:hypothetical protein